MKNKTKILIVEDEYITFKMISIFLEKVGYEIAGWSKKAEQALNVLKEKEVDCVILDINIKGDKNGIWLGEYIKKNHKSIPFLYLTAYMNEDVLLKALNTNPYGYLTKPFQKTELFSAIEIALFKHNELIKVSNESYNNSSFIYVKNIDVLEKVFLNDILFIESFKNYLFVYTKDSKYKIRSTIKSFYEEKLNFKDFIRTHRGFIINVNSINKIDRVNCIIYINKFEIPISTTYKEIVFSRLKV